MQIALILKLALMCWYADTCRSAKVLFTFENLDLKMEIMLKYIINYFNVVDRNKKLIRDKSINYVSQKCLLDK